MKAKKLDQNSFLIRLFPDEEIIASMQRFASKHQHKFISFSGIGAIKEVELSFFNIASKKYTDKTILNDLEILSLSGNIASFEDKPLVHAHINLSDKNFKAIGGHLKSAIISVTAEIVAFVYDTKVLRTKDNYSNLNLLDLEDHGHSQPI